MARRLAGGLNTLIVAQFVAGAAWGCMLMSAISAALAIGDSGAEGKVTGLVFSALALATFARMAAVAGGLQKLPEYAPLLHWAPVACWSVAGAGLLVIARPGSRVRARRMRRHAGQPVLAAVPRRQGFAGWMNVHGVTSESLGTSIAIRYGPPSASAFSSVGRK